MIVAVLGVLVGCAGPAVARPSGPADLVFKNGVVWTVDSAKPRAQAVAVRGDKIIYVGSNTGARRRSSSRTKVVDLKGRLLLPGFNDNHVHFDGTGRLLYGLSLLDVSDADTFTKRIRQIHRRYPSGTWITGGDWSAYETWKQGKVAKAGKRVDNDDCVRKPVPTRPHTDRPIHRRPPGPG